MKKIFGKLAVLLLMAIMCLSACLFASCGEEEKPEETPLKQYNVNVENVLPLGEVTANALKAQDGGTLYEIVVTPKIGYAVKTFKVNGAEVGLTDNKMECVLKQDISVTVDYCRKNSEELQRRQEMVVNKMNQYCDTYFKYDQDYSYNLNGRDITLKKGVLHGGLPYTIHSSISPDAYLDFAVSQDSKGVYTISFPSGYNPVFWGGSCANATFWAWSSISSSIRFTYSGNMLEKYGAYTVGVFNYDPETDIKNDKWQDTLLVCQNNGPEVMAEAYAMMNKGDAMQYMNTKLGNHVIIVTDIIVERGEDGKINMSKSKIVYSDQHGGYHNRASQEGKTVYSSTNCNYTKSFSEIYENAYLPMTCIELLDDSTPLAKAEFTDSIGSTNITKTNVLRGYIECNYGIRKGEMVITDANGAEVFKATRYGFETNPQRLPYSNFGTTDGEYGVANVYNDKLDLSALPAGEYHVVVTAIAATGESAVIRDYTFVN